MGEVAVEFAPIRLLEKEDTLDSFSSGSPSNDAWLLNHAKRTMKDNTARVYVLCLADGTLVGFYSLSTHSIRRSADVPGNLRRNAPDPIPCTLLGQLAVGKRFQGMSAGARLLQDAIKRAIAASSVVASRALVVDAIDEHAADFYRHFGFKDLNDSGRLYVKL